MRTVEQSSFQKPKTYSEYEQWKAEQAKNEAEEPEIQMIRHYKMNGYHAGPSSHHGASP